MVKTYLVSFIISLFFFSLFSFPVFIFAANQVDINTSSLQQLDEIEGIGPALAQRIIDSRPYSSVDDLLKVKGIGEKTLQKIKEQGLACVYCESTQIISESETKEVQSPEVQAPEDIPPESSGGMSSVSYPAGIIFNEILPSPEGADDQEEWIEIYNQNDFEIDLSGWQIKDNVGATKTYTFPAESKILAKGYLVVKRPDTKITLNNDEDELNLLSPDKKVVSSVSYEKALKNQSYNNSSSGWFWSSTLTPGAKNTLPIKQNNKEIISLDITSNSQLTEDIPPEIGSSVNVSETNQNKKTASAVGGFNGSKLSVFLLALTIAGLSGGIILYLKKILTRPF